MNVILVAMEKEAKYIDCPGAKVIVTGIGVNNVIKTLSKAILTGEITAYDTLINVGYAGSNCFNVGEIIAVNAVERFTPSTTVVEDQYPLKFNSEHVTKVAPCYSADDFIESDKEIYLVDMELYYIRAFFDNLFAFKIVSDNLNSKTYDEFEPELAWDRMNFILNKIINE